MKKTFFLSTLAFVIAALSLSSCEMFSDWLEVEFNTGYKEVPFTVEAVKTTGVHNLVEEIIASDIEEEIDENGGKKTELKDVRVDKAELEVVTPGMTLDIYNWVKVYVSAYGAAEKLIGSAYNIGAGLVVVTLNIEESEVMDMLEKDEYEVRVEAELGADLVEDMDMVLKIDYKVVVGP